MDPNVKPRQQKLRKIPYNVRKDLNEYLDEMENAGVITKLTLEDEHAGKWISNLVIMKKKWDEKKSELTWIQDT